ncbi:MAG: hypothetical protein ACFWTZ_04225 [Burkholderia sp.]|jgi:outer membrane autotransporter protein
MKLSQILSLIVSRRSFHRTLIAASVCSALCGAGFVAPALADEVNVYHEESHYPVDLNGNPITDAPNSVYVGLSVFFNMSGSHTFEHIKVNAYTDTVQGAIYDEHTNYGEIRLLVNEPTESGNGTPVDAMNAWLLFISDNQGTVVLANEGGVVDIGNYVYRLSSRPSTYEPEFSHLPFVNPQEWYLERVIETPEEPEEPVVPEEPVLSPSAETALLLTRAASQTALYLGQLDDLRKRLGDVRQQGEQNGAWVSFVRNRTHLSGYRGARLRNDAFRLNVGYDRKVTPDWLVGGYFHFTKGDQKARNSWNLSTGDSHSESFSLYATKLFDSGAYLDFVAGADRYHQTLRTHMLDGTPVKGRYNNWGMGLSVEAGHHFILGESKSWFAEPQVQLSYYRVKGDDFNLSNGMKIDQDSTDSLTGRAGLVFGRRSLDADGTFMGDFYLKAGLLYEFLGDQTLRLNGESFDLDGLGTRVYYGFGGERYLSRHGDESVKLYGQFERQEGNNFTQDFEFRLGLKYVF